MPSRKKAFHYENNFYLTCANQRISKIISQYELFKKTLSVPGAIVECGVFKGSSLIRFATLRDTFSNPLAKRIIGFDTFTEYPPANLDKDKLHRESFIEGAGLSCISKEQLLTIFSTKGIINIELVAGDIIDTVPQYVKEHPELKISLLHLDCTIYEPTLVALENFYSRILPGGIVIFNGYGKEGILGETKAVDEFFSKSLIIKRLRFSYSPCYSIKEVRSI